MERTESISDRAQISPCPDGSGRGCNPDFLNIDLTATKKFGKWEIGKRRYLQGGRTGGVLKRSLYRCKTIKPKPNAGRDLRPPVWLGSARAPFSPLWLPLPCSRKRRASVLLAPTYRHNKFPTARAFRESLAASPRTNNQPRQIHHSCAIKWGRAL